MEIKNLKIFAEVASGVAMTDVANTFGLTKGTVSTIISNIESEVGAELFIREKRRLTLTDLGAMFLDTAKRTIAVYEEGIDEMLSVKVDLSGYLRIGIGSFVEPFLRKAVAKMIKEYNELNIDAHVYRATTLNQLLKAGKIDVAFTLNEAYDGEGIISVPCIPVRIMAVMSKRHALAVKEKVSFEELCKYDCIMPSDDKRALATINRYINADLTKLRRRIYINTADGALNMVEEQNYITFMTPQHIINRPKLVALPIEGLEMEIMANMHYLQSIHPKRSAVVLKNEIENYAVPYFRMML